MHERSPRSETAAHVGFSFWAIGAAATVPNRKPAGEQRAIAEYGSKDAAIAALSADSLTGRLNEPDDIAWAAVFLAPDEARQITGTDLVIDGGTLVT